MSRTVMTGKSRPHGAPVDGLVDAGPEATHAAADDIRADDKIALGIDRTPWSDHGFPPARFPCHRVIVDHVLIASKRVADKDGVVALGVERTVGLVGDLQRPKIDAAVERQRIIRRKADQQRMRVVRFAPAIGEIERRASLGHANSFPDTPFWRLKET